MSAPLPNTPPDAPAGDAAQANIAAAPTAGTGAPRSAADILDAASAWWDTSIIDIHPGSIAVRGYPIQEIIGRLRYPEMVWLMLRGELASRGQSDLLEAALVAGVDHGPHAPSIAIARMAVTCGAGINGAMASAVNVLDDVHGGAGQQCMELYRCVELAIRDGDVRAAVQRVLAERASRGERVVPGFGHRFHPIDPRVAPLLALARKAAADGVVGGHFVTIGLTVEEVLRSSKGRSIPMNIDGVTAVIFSELGFAPELGRGLFILSRAVGILAHAWEQQQSGRRIMGPMPKDIPYRYSGPPSRPLPPEPNGDARADAATPARAP